MVELKDYIEGGDWRRWDSRSRGLAKVGLTKKGISDRGDQPFKAIINYRD